MWSEGWATSKPPSDKDIRESTPDAHWRKAREAEPVMTLIAMSAPDAVLDCVSIEGEAQGRMGHCQGGPQLGGSKTGMGSHRS